MDEGKQVGDEGKEARGKGKGEKPVHEKEEAMTGREKDAGKDRGQADKGPVQEGKDERKQGRGKGAAKEEVDKDMRFIVRIATQDLDGKLPIYRALTKIRGVGIRMARNIAVVFEEETRVPYNSRLGKLPEQFDKKLEEIVLNPGKHGIPEWGLNRKKEFETGENKHIVMADLDLQLRKDLQRLNEIKSYRGLRHSWGLTVRGQRTKSTHRGKGPVVGVMKKEARIAAAATGKGEEKK